MGHYKMYYQPVYNSEDGSISGCDVTITLNNLGSETEELDSFSCKTNDDKISHLFDHINNLFSPITHLLPYGFFIIININPVRILDCNLERECLNFVKRFGQDRIRLILQFSTKEELYILRRFQSSLRRMRNNGVYLSLNNFGMGYAELSHLQSMLYSYICLHKAMFHNIENNTLTDIITTSIVDLSKHLQIGILADGIETKKQANFMTKKGIKYLKGIALSPPLSEDAFTRKLLRYRHDRAEYAVPVDRHL